LTDRLLSLVALPNALPWNALIRVKALGFLVEIAIGLAVVRLPDLAVAAVQAIIFALEYSHHDLLVLARFCDESNQESSIKPWHSPRVPCYQLNPTGKRMANPQHVKKLRKGVNEWNSWRHDSCDWPDLSGADLVGADLTAADLIGADLRGADLTGATLRNALLGMGKLRNATLDRADLTGADLTGADLRTGKLRSANLARADFRGADLTGVDVEGADFSFVWLGNTTFVNCNLGSARNLALCVHHMPSHLDYETLRRSAGRLPSEFLRGCGLADWEISVADLYGPDLSPSRVDAIVKRIAERHIAGPVCFPHVFISYNWGDSRFVGKLENRLIASGWRVRRGVHDSVSGPVARQIAAAIDYQESVVVVLSKKSTLSDWSGDEMELAGTSNTRPTRDVLCPISLDDSWAASVIPSWERLALTRNILDFSGWTDDEQFDLAFHELVYALRVRCAPVEASPSK
jgi:uncharacterized protein YjbI with pentapeptide repeats